MREGTPIRALLFDLWGTLIVEQPEREKARRQIRRRLVHEALAAAGHAYPEDAVSAALTRLAETDRTGGPATSIDERVELLLEHVEPGLARSLTPDAFWAVEGAVGGAILQSPPLPAPGARETLEDAQRRGLALGLVSNTGLTPGYVLRELLAGYDLLPYLQVLTFSDEARFAKPAPEVFLCTLDALDVPPAEAAFIGDMPHLDVAGPQAVGMWTVQIGDQQLDGADRSAVLRPVEPHARIGALPELFPALERLGLLEG